MSVENKDLIVLGSGPGGYIAAIRAAQLGRKVAIIEKEALGGVCLNWGCIPSKALLKSASLYQSLLHSEEFGFTASKVDVDFPKVITRSRNVSAKLNGGVAFLMKKNKIEVIKGTGTFKAGNILVVDNENQKKEYKYNDIIIATGARPRVLPGVEIDGELVHTYRTILEYKKLPKKTLIVGGGVIGCEFAYFHRSFGAEVTIVEPLKHILPLEDDEIADGLTKSFTKMGIKVITGALASDIKKEGKSTARATLKIGDKVEEWQGDCILISVGVQPNIEGLGLDEIGIKLDRGFIKVDEFMQTSLPNHYAIGDVVGPPMLAHVASHEGLVAAEYLTGTSEHPMKYDNIPSCTYCQPQVASIGITEAKAKEQGIEYKVAKVPFSAIGKAIATGEQEGLIKVLINPTTEEILGVHILHSEATELIAQAAILRQIEGVASSVLETVYPHPTLSEAYLEVFASILDRPLST
jgi:dihydrolipoamide dehydrogenase